MLSRCGSPPSLPVWLDLELPGRCGPGVYIAGGERVNRGGKAQLECGQHRPMSWGPGLNKEKVNRAPASISLCSDCRCHAASQLPHTPTTWLPTTMNWTL